MSATTLRSFLRLHLFTDNDTRASSVNGYTDALSRTLDNDTRYGRFSQFLSQVLTYFKIAVGLSANSLVFANPVEFHGFTIPGRIPNRMYFLTHC